jgi:ribose transport system substrate-binding protein
MKKQCLAVVMAMAWMVLGLVSSAWAQKNYVIGFSQATTTEPWRILFNKELRNEALKYPEIKLVVKDAQDKVSKQIADVESFISMKADAILISPKVAAALTPVVNKAYDAGIPVFVLDRDLVNDKYTQFIGGDNKLIGRAAGEYTVNLLGGPGKAKGNVVEIWGGRASTPAQDRHSGFYEIVSKEPGIKILNKPEESDGDWKHDKAYDIMADALDEFSEIDVVYAHNDPMAHGAYVAAKDVGQEKKIAFLGIDGIPEEGIKWVYEGILTATFLYKTPGDEGIRQAMKLLKGESVPKRITLPTITIDKTNAESLLKAQGAIQ